MRTSERGDIPDKQIAYLFLDQCLQMLTPNGRLCLIQPSSFLYNLKSHGFRGGIAKTQKIRTILDFTSIRGLYGADAKTVAVLAGGSRTKDITHLTFRRTYRTAERIGFELDHYDRHQISVDDIVENPTAARPNLLGGGRLVDVAAKWRQMRTLGEYVDGLGWLMGEGFIVGNRSQPANHLTGKPLLPTEALTADGLDETAITEVTETLFEGPRTPKLFEPPLVLIREHESLPVAFWDSGVLTFKDQIVGVHADQNPSIQLERFYARLLKCRDFYRFALLLRSVRLLVRRATAVAYDDIVSVPFPEDESQLDLTFWEQALADDALKYMADFVRLGQRSELLKKAANNRALKEYATLFCRLLGSLYENLRAAEPVILDGLICQPFYFGDQPAVEWLGPDCQEQLSKLVFEETLPSLRTVRIVRFYHENVIFIVKPDRLRYWIRSTAIRDADDTLTELRKQGY